MEANTLHNIHQAFAATGIQPFNPSTVLANAKECAALMMEAENEALLSVELEKIPYTKCEHWLQTNQALQFRFSKTATSTTLCDLILHFSHTAEYYMTEANIARTESHNLQTEIEKVHPSEKDIRQLGRGNLAGVMTGKGIFQGMKEHDEKDAETEANCAAKAAKPAVTPYTKRWQVWFQLDWPPSTISRFWQSVIAITSNVSSTEWHYHPRPTASRCGLLTTVTQAHNPPVTRNDSPALSSPPPLPTPPVGRQLHLRK